MAGHFEAKKHAYRQTQDGVVISFVMHPNDVDAAIATAPLGTRYMIGFAEILENEQPKTELAQEPPTPSGRSNTNGETAKVLDSAPTKSPRKWNELSYAAQAGIRCEEPSFLEFLNVRSAEHAAQRVREECHVQSRGDITKGKFTGDCWEKVEALYQAYLTDRHYKEMRR